MGKNTFTISCPETGESLSCSINVYDPEILKAWWSYDEEGKNVYFFEKDDKRNVLRLGETMYFNVELRGVTVGNTLELQLFDKDVELGGVEVLRPMSLSGSTMPLGDMVDPDTDKFPDKPVIFKPEIKKVDGKKMVSFKVELQESWEQVITDDRQKYFNLDQNIELYFRARYKRGEKNILCKDVPADDNSILRVTYSDRTLIIRPPAPNYPFPEYITYKGEPMVLMDLGIKQLQSQGIQKLPDIFDKEIKKIALVKLGKGYMVDNFGKVYTGKRLRNKYKDLYTNSGELIENVKLGHNFKWRDGKIARTTRGISQYDFFASNGKRVTILRVLKNTANIFDSVFDFIDILKFGMDDDPTSKPLPLKLGPLTPLSDLAGVLVQEQAAELDALFEEVRQLQLDEAKLQGLEATRMCINYLNNNKKNKWELMPISKATANKLVAGEFKTFNELKRFEDNLEFSEDFNIQLLYRMIEDKHKEKIIYIIETIFIDE